MAKKSKSQQIQRLVREGGEIERRQRQLIEKFEKKTITDQEQIELDRLLDTATDEIGSKLHEVMALVRGKDGN